MLSWKASCNYLILDVYPSWFQAQDSVERWKDEVPNNIITLGSNQSATPTEKEEKIKEGQP